jgi:hypothetical protein
MRTPEELIRSGESNPLTAFFDADPAGWKPYFYGEYKDLGVAVDSQATMVINTNFAPYIWTHVTHGVSGNVDDPESSGLYNDGQYLVKIADERTNYTDKPLPANLLFGPHKEGEFAELPMPIFFPANHAVNVELTNIWTRVLTPISETFRVWIVLRGMQYWGQLQPPDDLLKMSRGL